MQRWTGNSMSRMCQYLVPRNTVHDREKRKVLDRAKFEQSEILTPDCAGRDAKYNIIRYSGGTLLYIYGSIMWVTTSHTTRQSVKPNLYHGYIGGVGSCRSRRERPRCRWIIYSSQNKWASRRLIGDWDNNKGRRCRSSVKCHF